MDSEVKQRWLEALRSGTYHQGRGKLRIDNRFCCLGVLADVEKACTWERSFFDVMVAVFDGVGKNEEMLPNDFLHSVGLTVDTPPEMFKQIPSNPATGGLDMRGPVVHSLAKMNDRGMTFDQIADVIEKYL